jgi:hypothetical protein
MSEVVRTKISKWVKNKPFGFARNPNTALPDIYIGQKVLCTHLLALGYSQRSEVVVVSDPLVEAAISALNQNSFAYVANNLGYTASGSTDPRNFVLSKLQSRPFSIPSNTEVFVLPRKQVADSDRISAVFATCRKCELHHSVSKNTASVLRKITATLSRYPESKIEVANNVFYTGDQEKQDPKSLSPALKAFEFGFVLALLENLDTEDFTLPVEQGRSYVKALEQDTELCNLIAVGVEPIVQAYYERQLNHGQEYT